MKKTLVTGGAKGLGSSICLGLAQKGYSVVVHYRESQKEAESIVSQCQALGVQADLIHGDFSTEESVNQFLKIFQTRFSEIDHVIHNVGAYFLGSAVQTPFSTWKEIFQTNFFAPLAINQALIPSLITSKGSIVHIGVAGIQNISACTYSTAYDQSKQALLTLTKSLAKELAPHFVRVNMISPGYLENSVDIPKQSYPMQRPAFFSEVVDTLLFLLDPNNSYITGQNIEIAGAIGL